MKTRDWIIGITAGILLGVLVVTPGIARRVVSAYASDETASVRELMLRSHTTWSTLKGEAVTVWHADERTEIWHTTFHFAQPNDGYLEWTTEPDGKTFQWFGSGQGFYLIDVKQKAYTRLPARDQRAFEIELKTLPTTLSEVEADIVYRHPFGAQIPSVLGDYLYSGSMAQGPGEYTLLGKDTLLGRPVYHLQYRHSDPQGNPIARAEYWVDAQTGIILKAVQYGGPDMQSIVEETTITAITLDDAPDTGVFRYQSAPDFKEISPEVYFSQQH